MTSKRKCALIVLDGLGDRAYSRFGHKTPLAAAQTPNLDRLAERGANGLYHAGRPGIPLPSENAHFAMFGFPEEDFPGRGPLEALGAGVDLKEDDVAVLSHFCSVEVRNHCLHLERDTPEKPDEVELDELFRAVASFEAKSLRLRMERCKGLFGVIVISGGADPSVTDSNPMVDGRAISEILPVRGAPPAAERTAAALKAYLVHIHKTLHSHPVNAARREKGLFPINAAVTQRAGRLKTVAPFGERFGLRGLSVSSGIIYHGLCAFAGMDVIKAAESDDPGHDLARRLATAREAFADYDFIHIHTKAPDMAAHKKDPDLKKAVIESLDGGLGAEVFKLLEDPDMVVAVTADHSTPSAGPLIHSGEPVPLCLCGPGMRRDAVGAFDEVSAACGSLGFLRGRELMFTLLNAMDRARLAGVRDTPEERLFWPGDYQPFRID